MLLSSIRSGVALSTGIRKLLGVGDNEISQLFDRLGTAPTGTTHKLRIHQHLERLVAKNVGVRFRSAFTRIYFKSFGSQVDSAPAHGAP
jgi:hypothetical protein